MTPPKSTLNGTATEAVQPAEELLPQKVVDGNLLTPLGASIDAQIEAGREFVKEYPETFRALAE
jgi:hypothetical protein